MQRKIATDSGRADSNGADGDEVNGDEVNGDEVNGDGAKNVTAIWIDKDINIKQGMDE